MGSCRLLYIEKGWEKMRLYQKVITKGQGYKTVSDSSVIKRSVSKNKVPKIFLSCSRALAQ